MFEARADSVAVEAAWGSRQDIWDLAVLARRY
jgi:hypothetical protein